MGWRQNPKERVDQFIGSTLVIAGPPFGGHAELLGVRVHAFPHGSEDHLKVYLEPVQKRQTSPVVYWGAQDVVGSRPVARAWRVQQVVPFLGDGGTPVEMVVRGVRMQGSNTLTSPKTTSH